MRYRITAYVLAWLTALVATDPTLGLWSLAWMFPFGLYAFFVPEHRQDAGWTIFILTMVIYAANAFFYFRARTTRPAVILFGVLVVLLFCNAAGCRGMIHAH